MPQKGFALLRVSIPNPFRGTHCRLSLIHNNCFCLMFLSVLVSNLTFKQQNVGGWGLKNLKPYQTANFPWNLLALPTLKTPKLTIFLIHLLRDLKKGRLEYWNISCKNVFLSSWFFESTTARVKTCLIIYCSFKNLLLYLADEVIVGLYI